MYHKKTDLCIYETNDYSIFKNYGSNRIISKNQRLENEIIEHNKLKFHPITVDKDMNIVDGQHRVEICKKNNLKVYYMIDENSVEEDVKFLQSSRNWIASDFLYHYSKLGRENYTFMDEMIKKYEVSISGFIRCFEKGESRDKQKYRKGCVEFRYGKEKIQSTLVKFSAVLNCCRSYFKKKKFHRNFETALIIICMCKNFSKDRMITAINTNPDDLEIAIKFNYTDTILEKLVELYNKRLRKQHRICL